VNKKLDVWERYQELINNNINRLLHEKDIDIAGLKSRIEKLEKEENQNDFNCPVCKHVTLAKKVVTSATYGYFCTIGRGRYCYTCGKTFEKKTETTYQEVTKDGPEKPPEPPPDSV
jgi:hypothetical protein